MSRIALVLATSLLAAAPEILAATYADVEVPAPLPAKLVTDTHHGVQVPDPYRYFEDVKDPAGMPGGGMGGMGDMNM